MERQRAGCPQSGAHRPAPGLWGLPCFPLSAVPERDTTHPNAGAHIRAQRGNMPSTDMSRFLAYVWVTVETWTPYG
jgi:hypothetical protein